MRGLINKLYELAKQQHYSCDDPWYTCPKHPDGCINSDEGPECNCGASEHNAEVEKIYKQLRGQIKMTHISVSKRFRRFLWYKCRTLALNDPFLGPEWARLAINKELEFYGLPTFLDPKFYSL